MLLIASPKVLETAVPCPATRFGQLRGHLGVMREGTAAGQSFCEVRVGAQIYVSSLYCRAARDSPELLAFQLWLRGLRCASLTLPEGLGARACLGGTGRRVPGGSWGCDLGHL